MGRSAIEVMSCSSQCVSISRAMVTVCSCVGSVNFDCLTKVVSKTFAHYKLTVSP